MPCPIPCSAQVLLLTCSLCPAVPPFQDKNQTFMDNPNRRDPTTLFLAGDKRANEQSMLLALHVLFLRSHNWWARRFLALHPEWNDEQLFQAARKMNRAEIQKM